MSYRPEELLIAAIAALLEGASHVAVGAISPIPAAAALLARERSGRRCASRSSAARQHNFFTDGGRELFDCAAQGRIDVFFLGGAQIDGAANINLVGIGGYPQSAVRLPGSFGSAHLYFLVPRVILFQPEHSRRTLVRGRLRQRSRCQPPGRLSAGRAGRARDRSLRLQLRPRRGALPPGARPPRADVEEIRENTGFDFDAPAQVPATPEPDGATLASLRGEIGRALARAYPAFAARVLGHAARARIQA